MSVALEGVIRGRTIELETDSGIADGEKVRLIVAVRPPEGRTDGATTDRTGSAGMLANHPDLDASLEEILADRRREALREMPE